jgi:hypothetical protein
VPYHLAARTTIGGATSGNAGFGIWNPSTTVRCRLLFLAFSFNALPTALVPCSLRRTSTRGTATPAIVADVDNDDNQTRAPDSGLQINYTYTAQPTIDAVGLYRWDLGASIGQGVAGPIEICDSSRTRSRGRDTGRGRDPHFRCVDCVGRIAGVG